LKRKLKAHRGGWQASISLEFRVVAKTGDPLLRLEYGLFVVTAGASSLTAAEDSTKVEEEYRYRELMI